MLKHIVDTSNTVHILGSQKFTDTVWSYRYLYLYIKYSAHFGIPIILQIKFKDTDICIFTSSTVHILGSQKFTGTVWSYRYLYLYIKYSAHFGIPIILQIQFKHTDICIFTSSTVHILGSQNVYRYSLKIDISASLHQIRCTFWDPKTFTDTV